MTIKHIIIAGKSEVSNFLKIYFPSNFRYLPEMTTELVKKHKINILIDRNKLTDSLTEEILVRQDEIASIKKDFITRGIENGIILEESHIGVHWAYSKHLGDSYFLNAYTEIKKSLVFPDFFIRLLIPFDLSFRRQIARNTPALEVSAEIIKQMYDYLVEWHQNNHNREIKIVDADRSPAEVISDIMEILNLKYIKSQI